MSVVANIAVNVDATKAIGQLRAVDSAAAGASGAAGKLGSAFGNLNTAIAALGIGALVKDLTTIGIDADRTSQRIKNLGDANGETAKIFSTASKAAKEFGLGTLSAEKGMADLYGRLRPAGIGLKDIETTFYGVNKAALAAGLSTADTNGVFLQLAQAMGSGKLQGDELRSIMERMPAVGQAVAKVMGVTVGEIKQLGADGLITTEVMIKAAEELNKLKPPAPDSFRLFNAAMEDLRVELGENILPILTPFIQVLLQLVKGFGAMPEPIQTAVVALGLLVTAILAIGSAAALLTPVITAFGTLATAVGLGSAVAAAQAALGGLLAWVGSTLIPGLLAFFSGPVGWTVLAVAAVVAMVVLFKEPIMEFISWLWKSGEPIRKFFVELWGNISTLASDAFKAIIEFANTYLLQPLLQVWQAIEAPIKAVLENIKSVFGWYMQATWAVFDTLLFTPLKTAWGALVEVVDVALKKIQGAADSAWKTISDAFDTYISKPISKAWDALMDSLGKLLDPVVKTLSSLWQAITSAFTQYVSDPINKAWTTVTTFLPDALKKAGDFIKSIWGGVINGIKQAIRGVLQWIANAINNVAGLVNNLIKSFNALPGADIPLIAQVQVPAFAEGGVVTKPTLAMVGEGGEPEYIVPESKMAATAANYLDSQRGASSLKSGTGNTTVNITTGPVVEFNGERYVTVADMERGLQLVASSVLNGLRTPAGRYATGIR